MPAKPCLSAGHVQLQRPCAVHAELLGPRCGMHGRGRCVHQAQSVSLEEISVIAAGDEPAEPVLKSGNTEGSREFEAKVQSFLKTAAVTRT